MKARKDAVGLFWVQKPKEAPKKSVAPLKTWESPDYLPYLNEAREFKVSLFTTTELIEAHSNRETLVCDVECFYNYFLVAFASIQSGKIAYFELSPTTTFNRDQLRWILHNFKIVTFNGISFDLPIITLALYGLPTEVLKHASGQIINEQTKSWIVLRQHKVQSLKIDHIDLIEVAPLQASLKIYGGRLHVPKMQELPFHHELTLSPDQIAVVRWYCINSDLTATAFLYCELLPQIQLRESMSAKYGTDLRSKSDAQIAEAVIVKELIRLTGVEPTRTDIAPGTEFKYKVPSYVNFKTDQLKSVLKVVSDAKFVIEESGAPKLPKEIGELKITIGGSTYQMGLGGLHSCETCVAHYADETHEIREFDVTGYYPKIILTQGLFPMHLGPAFLEVFRSLVDRRTKAKREGNKVEADSLKICCNSCFGKMGSKWAVIYAPDLMLQVTLSGQLSLLMLIERLEAAFIPVVSANTDGVLIRCPKPLVATMKAIIAEWEMLTGFETEENQYAAVFSKDVNNYCGIGITGKTKTKGCFSDVSLSKNPVNLICSDALVSFLTTGTPIATTIRSCRDIRRFLSVRTVKGGAVKDGHYLGKAIRWYQSNEVEGDIIYAVNGNKVPNSERCRPCMDLPRDFPKDMDFGRYEEQTLEMLREIGYR